LDVVRGLRKYVIPFTGLKDGKHTFNFIIDDRFFEAFEGSEVKNGNVDVVIELNKTPRFLELHFNLEGKVRVMCDRCLDMFDLAVEFRETLYFRFGEESYEQSENVIILSPKEYEIDVAQYLYEFVHLALPYQKIHPEMNGKSGCNKRMIEKLNELRVEQQKTDPRWEQLKEISDKN
jgi:uncharacterized protein